jgi:hypothetical protein
MGVLAQDTGSNLDNAYPGNEDVLGQRCVWVLDLDKSELDAAVREFIH